jgi:predicted Zn-dependent protease
MDIFIVSNEEFKIIIKHELGHLLGCSHSNNENSIMYLYTNNNKGKILQEQLDEIL